MINSGDLKRSGARWVCPNDRQLALRAKLRTGWSVKTGSLDSRYGEYTYTSSHPGNSASSTPVVALTDEERSMIIQVIQRAEALDLAEQERVGRLVERLENMKRNVSTAMGSGTTERTCGSRCAGGTKCVCSCALCGERFAVLGAGPGLCKDCRRYICQKCGIEATPAVTSPSASAPASTSTTSQVGEVAQRLLRRRSSTASAQRLFLCRICAETREMWKKSGAWFFKGLPKYILPEKKDRGRPRAGSRASGWTLASSTRRLDSLEQDSSSDDDATRRLGLMRRFSTTVSSGDHSSREDAPTSTTDEKSLHSLAATTPSVAYRRQSSCPTPEMSFLGGDSSSKTSEVPRAQISPSPSSVTVRSRKSPNGVQQVGFPDLDEPVEEQRSSSPQVQLRRLSSGERRSPREANVEPEWNRCRVRAGLGQDKQSRNQAQTVLTDDRSVLGTHGPGPRDPGGLLAIRPSGSVPPMQGPKGPRPPAHGHPRPRGPLLQAQHSTSDLQLLQAAQDEDRAQNQGPGIQRDGQFLRDDRGGHEEFGPPRSDPAGRPRGPRFSGRGEVPLKRAATLSDQSLQRLPGEPLPGGPGRRGLGGGYQPPRAASINPKLQYSAARVISHRSISGESLAHGQQRVL
ncbi:translation initiation factor IF-2 isoform X3 [Orussus abietinus]|uniref:translation initiation factor IF-2 isoform X3 n=1 Tax=Orussus abietinus TaxID=222816 RepID=UPI0006252C6D|nr:translation initiation factor IF-2 isoform X3 [Orussus abietinus]